MKYIILLGDGMADWHETILKGKTLLQYLDIPNMDWLARCGRNGLLKTVPEGFHPGSEVANSSILGYDQRLVYEGRGPLEAASIGVELEPGDLALRCNLVSLEGDVLKNHSCGRLETEEGQRLIEFLQERLGSERVHFYPGVQYRHLLVLKGGDKRLRCVPPHDIPLKPWRENLPEAEVEEAEETAKLLRSLMEESQRLLPTHPLNVERVQKGLDPANSIWPWGGGYRPKMEPLTKTFPQLRGGAVITAVDLIRGIGKYAGLRVIDVEGATGRWDTDYEAKARAAIEALRTDDFVYLHVEASDEAGHDGDRELKLRTIKDFDSRLVGKVIEALGAKNTDPTADRLNIDGEPVAVALLPDHPTPVKLRTHTAEPVPFCICKPGVKPDGVSAFSEADAVSGSYGLLRGDEFIRAFLQL
ncbi:MAG: cofactor-independent phosphoglycerate mutase [Prevotellaceae bacterium]|nr:cofactor-independent phosphoglycerate mutase [Prevotellaceae bacterium]